MTCEHHPSANSSSIGATVPTAPGERPDMGQIWTSHGEIDFEEDLYVCRDCACVYGPSPRGTAVFQGCDCAWLVAGMVGPRRDVEDKASIFRLCWCCTAAIVHGAPTAGPYVCEPCLDDIAELHDVVGRHVVPVSPHADHDKISPRSFPGRPVSKELLGAVGRLGESPIPFGVAFSHRHSRTAVFFAAIGKSTGKGICIWQYLEWCTEAAVRATGLQSIVDFAVDANAWRDASPETRRIFEAG